MNRSYTLFLAFIAIGMVSSHATDLLTVDVHEGGNGKTVATIVNTPGAGICLFDESRFAEGLFPCEGIRDLVGERYNPTLTVIVDDIFGFGADPGPRAEYYLPLPVEVCVNEQFFGIVGFVSFEAFGDPAEGYTEAELRDELMIGYKVEVNGVAFSGDKLPVKAQAGPVDFGGGLIGYVTTFDSAMVFKKPGEYVVRYSAVNTRVVNGNIMPGIATHEFLINVVPKGKKSDD